MTETILERLLWLRILSDKQA